MQFEYELSDILKKQLEEYGINKWYPESNEWDAVFVYNNLTIGIQFKLKLSLHAIAQCLLSNGVDYRVLVVSEIPEKHKQDFLIILNGLRIIPVLITDDEKIDILFKSNNPYWLLKYKHRSKKKLKLINIDEQAGSKAPLRSTERNIFLVELENKSFENNNRGVVSNIYEVIDILGKIPKQYLYYDFSINKWRFRMNNLPSVEFPHIKKGLTT